jgi:hypothetical protein
MATIEEIFGNLGTYLGVFFNNIQEGAVIFFISLGVVFGVMSIFALITFVFRKISET